ncbi:MAG: hypothetical protein WCJ35_07320 [Planctomycetota bacterium]
MIDRTKKLFVLQARTQASAAAISFALFSLLPLAAFICLLAGWIVFVGCWILIVVLGLLSYGVILGGGLSILAALLNKKGVLVGGGIAGIFIGCIVISFFQSTYQPLVKTANTALTEASESGGFLFRDVFIAKQIYLWSWFILAAFLLVFCAVSIFLGLLLLEPFLKHALFRIGYACPNCHRRGVPLFRCSNSTCNNLIRDLRPSAYGIFRARCGKCGATLPTADIFGRLALQKVCARPECSKDLDESGLGHHAEFHIGIIGAPSSGKSNMMLTSIWQLEQQFAPENHLTVDFANPAEKQAYKVAIERLLSGQVADKTRSQFTPKALTLLVQSKSSGFGSRLYIYDAAGEDFCGGDGASGHRFHQFVDAIIFVIDPFAEQSICNLLSQTVSRDDIARTNPASASADAILATLVSRLEDVMQVPAGGKFLVPVAVVLTKCDACGLENRIGKMPSLEGQYLSIATAANDTERQSSLIRQFLVDAGLSNVVQILTRRFPRVCYFLASALSPAKDRKDGLVIAPRNVVAPLIWASFHSQALTGSPPLQYIAWNAWAHVRRSLRGQEGGLAQMISWSIMICAVAVLVSTLWYGIAGIFGGARRP